MARNRKVETVSVVVFANRSSLTSIKFFNALHEKGLAARKEKVIADYKSRYKGTSNLPVHYEGYYEQPES
jgi:hypothetical protein